MWYGFNPFYVNREKRQSKWKKYFYPWTLDVFIGRLDDLIQVKTMNNKEGKELATVKVYLNTGIIAGLIGVGFIASTLVFGVLLLVLR